MPPTDHRIETADWIRLVFLSVLWGGSFLFIGIAIKEVPPITLVFARVAMASVILVPVMWIYRVSFPKTLAGWWPFIVLSLLNNVIPQTLLAGGQAITGSGVASVINATTPVFSVLILAAFGDERLIFRRLVGVLLGLAGVGILSGFEVDFGSRQSLGILLCLGATITFGFCTLWAKRKLNNSPPLLTATCQLTASTVMMFVLCIVFDRPWQLPMPSVQTWLSLISLAVLSTAVGFLLFFKIMQSSGASNVMLVTLLVPMTAMLLGYFFLHETVTAQEIIGALVIASALLIMDGRLLNRFANWKASV